MSDYLHSQNQQLGLHVSEGLATQQSYPGSLWFEDVDSESFVQWGVDSVVVDLHGNSIVA